MNSPLCNFLTSSSMASNSIKTSSFSSSLLDSIYRSIDDPMPQSNRPPVHPEAAVGTDRRQIDEDNLVIFRQETTNRPPDSSQSSFQHSKSERNAGDSLMMSPPPLDSIQPLGRSTTTSERRFAITESCDTKTSARRRISRFLNSLFNHRSWKKDKSPPSEKARIPTNNWMRKSRSVRCGVFMEQERHSGKKRTDIHRPWMTPPIPLNRGNTESGGEDQRRKRELESQSSSDLFELETLTSTGNGRRWKSEG